MVANPDNRRINHGIFHVWLIRDGIKQTLENPSPHPIAETLEHRVRPAQQGRQVLPQTVCEDDPQRGFKKQTHIPIRSLGIARLAKTKRLRLRPLHIGQDEAVHSKFPRGAWITAVVHVGTPA